MMHTATILSPGYSLPSAKLPGLTRDTNIPGSPCIKFCPFPPTSLIPSLVDLSLATEKKYIHRGNYKAAWRYEISLRVLKNISRVSAATPMKYQTISLTQFFSCERRDLLCSHSNGDIFTCENNMLFSRVKISCFRAKAHLVFHWCLHNKYKRFLSPSPMKPSIISRTP